MGEALATLPAEAFAFALLLARVGASCSLLPGVGEAEMPATVRAGFALALCVLLLPAVAPLLPAEPGGVTGAAALVVTEVATGLWLGWLARLLVLALPMAGQVIASLAGWSNLLQPDLAMGGQSSAVARALGMAAPAVILASGLHALPLMALAGSYRLVPPGAVLPSADGAAQTVAALGGAFALASRLAAPFVLGGLVWQAGLGLLARLIPQLQVYFVAMPGQILGGVLLLALLSSAVLGAWQAGLATGFAALLGAGQSGG